MWKISLLNSQNSDTGCTVGCFVSLPIKHAKQPSDRLSSNLLAFEPHSPEVSPLHFPLQGYGAVGRGQGVGSKDQRRAKLQKCKASSRKSGGFPQAWQAVTAGRALLSPPATWDLPLVLGLGGCPRPLAASSTHPPHHVEEAEQAGARGRAPDDGDVQVDGDGHGPEEGAGVGEGGQGALQHAVPRRGAEVLEHPVEVGGG